MGYDQPMIARPCSVLRWALVHAVASAWLGASCSGDGGRIAAQDVQRRFDSRVRDLGLDADPSDPDAGDTTPIDLDAGLSGQPVDRVGRPLITAVLLHRASQVQKDAFNEKAPHALIQDATLIAVQESMLDVISGMGVKPLTFGGLELTATALKKMLIKDGDTLRINSCDACTSTAYLGVETGVANSFGGRSLDQDVIDISLAALSYQALTRDGVDENDRPLSRTFPYLAAPH